MANDQTVNLNIKAVDQASAEMAKIAASVANLERSTRSYGTATGPAKAAAAQFYDTLRAGRGIVGETATGLGGVNKAAKDLAQGGLRDVLSEVPIVGGALSKLAGTLGGFPLLLTGIAGAGLGVLKFLQGLGQESDKALDSVSKLAAGIGTDFKQTLLEVQRIQAEAAGDSGKAIELGAQKAIEAARARVDALIEQAEREKKALDLFGRERGEANRDTLDAMTKAEADFANTVILENARKNAGLQKLEAERVADAKKAREEEVKAAELAAEKQKQLLEDLTSKSLSIFKRLGDGFKDVAQSLELAQFVQTTKNEIDTLNQAIEQGVDTHGRFADGVEKLQEKMAEAIRLGYVPTTEAVKETTAAVEALGDTAETAGERWLRSLEGISPALDAIAARTRAARDAAGGAATSAASGGGASVGAVRPEAGSGPTGVSGLDTTVLGPIANQSPGSGLRPFNPDFDLPHFAAGGVVPGPTGQPRVIVAHGGEEVTPAGKRSGVSRTTVNHVTVNISGTVVQQERDWNTMVEHLGQALDVRAARYYGR